MQSVAEQSDLVLHNMSAHPFPNHLADAALGKLLTMNATTQPTAIAECETILKYMFDKHMSFGLSFGGVFAAPLLRRYGHLLSPATHHNLTTSLYALLPKTPNASAPADVSYNNIYLMNAANLITIGELLMELGGSGPNAKNAVESGYALLQAWLEYTYSQGIHEFTSPTYTWVQFEGMYPIYLYAKVTAMGYYIQHLRSHSVRTSVPSHRHPTYHSHRHTRHTVTQDPVYAERIGTCLDHLWAQLAANFFRGDQAQQLSGAHSRWV
jgi:hypothetical protein